MSELKLGGSLDLKIGEYVTLAIDNDEITINDFSEKSEAVLTHRVDGLEITTIKNVHTIHWDFKETESIE